MLEHGFIRPSDSPYGALVLFTPKKDGSLRFSIDYRWLNKRTVRNRYPLPLPEEMLDHLGGTRVYSKIDLKLGYWQMPIRGQDIPKTAFRMRWGLYEFLVMRFGVTSAPLQFMHMINDVLAGYLDVFILVFLDDTLVYSRTVEEHAKHLWKVFAALRKHQLFAKASKCSIMVKEVDFLDQWVTPQGASLLKEKLKAVRSKTVDTLPAVGPNCGDFQHGDGAACSITVTTRGLLSGESSQIVKDVRSFMGFANYYCRFISKYAEVAAPLTYLTKKDVEMKWGPP